MKSGNRGTWELRSIEMSQVDFVLYVLKRSCLDEPKNSVKKYELVWMVWTEMHECSGGNI
jgi:hypothetical protein